MRWLPFAGGLLAGVLVVGAAAAAYTEAHQLGDDVHIRVDSSGRAHVEHTETWRVLAGQKHTLDLVGVEPGVEPDVQASVTDEEGQELTAHVAVRPGSSPTVLEATLDDPKGMRRGKYRVRIAYDVDFVRERELVADGPSWRLAWRAPAAPDGLDTARVIFDLPSAPTKPRAVVTDSDTADDSVIATLRKSEDNDELEVVRAHVARGESLTWSILLSPRALSSLPWMPSPSVLARNPSREQRQNLAWFALLIGIGVAYAGLVHMRRNAFAATCRAAGTSFRGLLPGPAWVGPPTAGVAVVAGVMFEASGSPVKGAALLAVAMLCAVVRPRRVPVPARGPGRWLAFRPDEVLSRRPPRTAFDAFDLATRPGKGMAVASAVAVALAGMLARRFAPSVAPFAWLDAAILIPLFTPGTRAELPPDVTTLGYRLRPFYLRLVRSAPLRVLPWARVPMGAHDPDEVRLLVVPRASMPGVLGIEVGLAHAGVAVCMLPEVLVRVREASAASARMTVLTPRLVPLPGRQPEERVYRLSPRFPTVGWTRALVERLGRELVDRRTTAVPWNDAERRIPVEARAKKSGQAEPQVSAA